MMYGKSVLTIQLHFTRKEQGCKNNLPVLVSQGLVDLYKQDKSYCANIFLHPCSFFVKCSSIVGTLFPYMINHRRKVYMKHFKMVI